MSASREKKARQELNESGYVDPRKAREAEEKAKERRSTRIYTAIIVAFVLLGVVLFASGRIQASNEAKETARIGAALDAILNHAGAEYMDCYNAGIPADVWLAAGFTERVEGDGCIIPNYLTPPVHENTEYYYFTNKPESFVMFKADGDQDRPNLK